MSVRGPLGRLAQRLPNTVEFRVDRARRRLRCGRGCALVRATGRMATSSPTKRDVGKQRQLRRDRREILDVLGREAGLGNEAHQAICRPAGRRSGDPEGRRALVLTRGASVLPTQTERTPPSTKAGCSMATRIVFLTVKRRRSPGPRTRWSRRSDATIPTRSNWKASTAWSSTLTGRTLPRLASDLRQCPRPTVSGDRRRAMPKPPLRRTWSPFWLSPTLRSSLTIGPDGSLHTAATWYLWVDGRVLVNMDEGRRRLEHLRQEPRVLITVLGREDWYHHVTLRGHVAELMPDPQSPTSTASLSTTQDGPTLSGTGAGPAPGSR